MQIALTGASGFIGSFTAKALADAGHGVVALVRPSSPRDHITPYVERYVVGDHADASIWPQLLEGVDGIVHNSLDWEPFKAGELRAQLDRNLVSSIELLHAAHGAGVNRFVFVSTIAVYADILDRWEHRPDEDHPQRPGMLYGACKAATEPYLWDAHIRLGMHTAAIRPCGVYGVEPVRLHRSYGFKPIRNLLRGERITKDDFPGGGKFVHVEDTALAIVRAMERDEAAGQGFNLTDCYAKFTRFAEHARDILGLDASMVVPDDGPAAVNTFAKDRTQRVLGVAMDRGDSGLREHAGAMIDALRGADADLA